VQSTGFRLIRVKTSYPQQAICGHSALDMKSLREMINNQSSDEARRHYAGTSESEIDARREEQNRFLDFSENVNKQLVQALNAELKAVSPIDSSFGSDFQRFWSNVAQHGSLISRMAPEESPIINGLRVAQFASYGNVATAGGRELCIQWRDRLAAYFDKKWVRPVYKQMSTDSVNVGNFDAKMLGCFEQYLWSSPTESECAFTEICGSVQGPKQLTQQYVRPWVFGFSSERGIVGSGLLHVLTTSATRDWSLQNTQDRSG
jgi:hypothetical protein